MSATKIKSDLMNSRDAFDYPWAYDVWGKAA
jgi:hypothetical protein